IAVFAVASGWGGDTICFTGWRGCLRGPGLEYEEGTMDHDQDPQEYVWTERGVRLTIPLYVAIVFLVFFGAGSSF
ncbi:MAG: hypothetical protein PVJ76_12545, partial [Gemmatimonadota bacterium]